MDIKKRLINSYSYGGMKEIVRKIIYYYIYKINNAITTKENEKAPLEYGLNKKEREDTIVVSLTSFPARFSKLDLCLKSIITQKFKPDKIIVYLGSDSSESMLTEDLLCLKKYGVDFRFDKEKNIMSHKKYYYAMQEYPYSIIITADDDVIYPKDWIESLYNSYKKYPSAVSARRVHLMKRRGDIFLPYDHWEDQCRRVTEPTMNLIATGNSGVLYPPHCFGDMLFDITAIENLCIRADDLWLKCAEVKYKIPIVWVRNWEVSPAGIEFETDEKLSNLNIFTGKNDDVLYKLMDHFEICIDDFFAN